MFWPFNKKKSVEDKTYVEDTKTSFEVETVVEVEEENSPLEVEIKPPGSKESTNITRRNGMKVTYNLNKDDLFEAIAKHLDDKYNLDIEDLDFEFVIDGKAIEIGDNTLNAISFD